MKSAYSRFAAAALLVILVSGAASAQGLYWESSVKTGTGEAHTTKNYMMPHLMKVEHSSGDMSEVILNLDKQTITSVNRKAKTYSETPFDTLTARLKELNKDFDQRNAEVQRELKSMPEAQRQKLEKMMSQMGDQSGEPVVVKTGTGTKTILGYACSRLDVMRGEKVVMSLWLTKQVKGFDALKADWKEFSRRLASQLPGAFGKAITEGMTKADGFPMETVMGPAVTTVTKLEARAIPASVFAIPAGYTKTEDRMFNPKR